MKGRPAPARLFRLLPIVVCGLALLGSSPAAAQSTAAASPPVGGSLGKLDALRRQAEINAELARDATTWQGFDQLPVTVRQNLLDRRGLAPLASAIGQSNVRANNPAGDLTNEVQCQVTVAASGATVLAVWLDSKGFTTGTSFTGFAWSCDYGRTFTDGGELAPPSAGGQPADAVVASDGNGTFYLLVDVYTSGTDTDRLYFYHGAIQPACGFAWSGETNVATSVGPYYFHRFAVAADPADAHVFVAWSHDAAAPSRRRIEVRASDNGGAIWGTPKVVGDDAVESTENFKGYDFPRLAVGTNDLYVSWTNHDGDYHWCDLSDNANFRGHFLYINRSSDHGLNWGTQALVKDFYSNYYTSGPGDFWSWGPAAPSLAVDRSGGPFNGRLYLTWPEPAPWGPLTGNGNTTNEVETNNLPATATPVTLGDDVTGIGATTGDADYFRINLTAGEPVFLQLEPEGNAGCFAGSSQSLLLRLYPTPTNLNATPPAILAASLGNGYLSRIVFTPRWSGAYYMRVLLQNPFGWVPSPTNIPYRVKTRSMVNRFPAPTPTYPMRDEGDIVSIYSSDGGSTWSDRLLVNSDAPVGYAENRPVVVVNSDGRVCLFWHDMRETSSSPPAGDGIQTDIYMAESTTGGASWSAGRRISDASSPFLGSPKMNPNIGFWGVGAAATGRYVYAGWPDGRNPGTVSGVDVYTNLLDYEPPTAQITIPPVNGWSQGCWWISLSWTGSDAITPTASLQFAWELDGAGYSEFGGDTHMLLDPVGLGLHTFSVKARDAFGNESAPVSRTFTIVASPPHPDLANLPVVTGECAAAVTTTPGAKSACGAHVVGTTPDPLSYSTQGTYQVHWSYDDGHGNVSGQVQQVIVQDTEPPVPSIANLPAVTGVCTAAITGLPPHAMDSCAGKITGVNLDPLSYSTLGTHTVRWRYDDGHGNSSEQTQDVVVTDSHLLIDTQPVDVTACIGEEVAFGLAASSLAPLTYQWYRKGGIALSDGPTGDGSSVSGTHGPILTVNPLARTTSYYCIVSDGCGSLRCRPGLAVAECAAPTPTGTSVPVELGARLGLVFGQVSHAGSTTVTADSLIEPLPPATGGIPKSAPIYYDIRTTAQITGSIQVCIHYDPADVTGNPAGIRLYHKDGTLTPPAWVDITTSLDKFNHVVCGTATSLSPFALVEADNQIAPGPAPSCISQAHPCIRIPISIDRGTATPIRAFSAQVTLSPNLALCDSGVVEGSYLRSVNPGTAFEVTGGASTYTVDGAILGLPCGATAATGNLFYLKVARVGPPTGTGTITVDSVLLRDCDNAVVAATPGSPLSLTIDAESPASVTDLAAAQVKSGNGSDGTTTITLNFTPPGDAATVEVYRAPWGGYPEYDDAGFVAPPAVPTYPPGGTWTPTAVTASGQSDEPPTRDFWYYVVFTKDACGNVSAVSNRTGGTLDYHLGDTHTPTAECVGDNLVNTSDVSFLGANYGAVLGYGDPLACLDVGPTTNGSVDARPTTDNRLQFEDLIVFAMNYGQVSAPAPPAATGTERSSTLALRSERAGNGFDAVLDLGAGEGLQGVSVDLNYDAAVVRPVEVVAGELLARQGVGSAVLSSRPGNVDVALLGRGASLTGSGELARLHFERLGPGEPGISVGRAEGRDTGNRPVRLVEGTTPVVPPTLVAVGLRPAYPNPFHGSQRLVVSLPASAPARLQIFDVAGHLVRTLLDGVVGTGDVGVEWDGQDGAGRPVASGLYLARLESGGHTWTRHLLKAE